MTPDSILSPHSKNEQQHRRMICKVGRWLYEHEYIVALEGNLSVRLDDGRVLMTPTRMNKGMLAAQDLVITDLDGRQLAGDRKFSSEVAMHLLFYHMRTDVNAVCHAHPPTATGFAVAGRALSQALLPEMIVGLGQVPLVHYATPGTRELSAALEPFVPHYDALLLANHGAVTCGPDLLTAFFHMETIEHCAKITLIAELAGEPNLLSHKEVAKLIASSPRYSVRTHPSGGARLPVCHNGETAADDSVLPRVPMT
jgi:L-fuculose-phosphate aldolase